MLLASKIKIINATVDFARVAYLTYQFEVEVGQRQINCPTHTDNNKSARLYYNTNNPTSNGLYCFVCGNSNTYSLVHKALGEDHKETLKWFNENFTIDFGQDIEENTNHKKISKMIKKIKTQWSNKDLITLQKTIIDFNNKKLKLKIKKILTKN